MSIVDLWAKVKYVSGIDCIVVLLLSIDFIIAKLATIDCILVTLLSFIKL